MAGKTVGVLALQGDVAEHLVALEQCGVATREVRTADDLAACDGLILPGGESTTMGRLLNRYDLLEPLQARGRAGMPMYGTCAGLILLAREVQDGVPGQPSLGLLDATAVRNAYGRQVDSFESDLALPALGEKPFHAVFIRAPGLTRLGSGVETLGQLGDKTVAVRQGNVLATSFHPELSGDLRLHRYFVSMIEQRLR
ncbi:MAG TPA: pyridoxal 5'-phosphate synthase glutaminase subunit PdxT [Candidatus Xenobia bacterium]